jgi:hypothetical protein
MVHGASGTATNPPSFGRAAGEPDGRAERAKSRSVNMAGIVAQRVASKWRKKTLKVPLIGAN